METTKSECIIRDAVSDDLLAILEIFNDAILNTTSSYQYKAHTLEMRTAWYNDRLNSGFPVIVATTDNIVVGFGSYGNFRSGPAYKYSVENTVYVHKDYRGRGISKKILEYLIKHAQEHDFHTIVAGIDANNTISMKLHEKFGFQEVGYFKQVGFKFGEWLDLKFYQLILKTPEYPVDG